jgi:two-component system, chemotaxis family, response regulator Rcp1
MSRKSIGKHLQVEENPGGARLLGEMSGEPRTHDNELTHSGTMSEGGKRFEKGEEMMKTNDGNDMTAQVLLVEDSPGDVRLTQEAFRETNRSVHLHVVTDGVEALMYLRNEGGNVHAPRPDLILLDLNLPKMDGREVLAHIKEDDSLKTIPTVILTTSVAEADIEKSYQLQANCYLSKPVELDEFENLVKSINDFWLTKARLPQRPPDA